MQEHCKLFQLIALDSNFKSSCYEGVLQHRFFGRGFDQTFQLLSFLRLVKYYGAYPPIFLNDAALKNGLSGLFGGRRFDHFRN